MEINKQENTLVILEKNFNYAEALDTLAKVDSKFWCNLFLEVGIQIPRSINVQALTLALNKKIIEAKNLGLTDELLYRLRSYPYFTEYQLQQFFNVVYDDELFFSYKRYFGNLILQNYELLSMPEEILLKALNYNQDNKETFDEFEKNIFNVSYDFNGFFDGEELDSIKEHLVKGSTTNEIRELGQKYGLNIPKRLKKEELQAILLEELEKNGTLTKDLESKIKTSAAISLQRIAKTNGIKISIDLKKDELVYLLLRELEKSNYPTKEFLYLNLYLGDDFVFNLSYVTNEKEEVVENTVEETVVEEVIEEPVIEQVVVEEPIVEEPKVIEEVKQVEDKIEVLNEDQTPVVSNVNSPINATINIDTNQLIAALGQTIKETVSEITKQILPIVNSKNDPVINVYNQLKAEDLADEDVIEENIYEFENFSDQLNPYYDSEIAKTMNYADKKQIEPQYEVEEEMPVEEEIDLSEDEDLENQEETDEVLDKKELKKAKKAAAKEKKRLAKEAKLEKKKAKKEAALQEKQALKEQKQQELEKAIEEKNQAKVDAKQAKKQLKEDNKNSKREAKEKIAQTKRNRKSMEKAIRTGILTDDIDDAYFEKQMRLREYRNKVAIDEREERRYKRRRNMRIVNSIILIIFILFLAYAFLACALIFDWPFMQGFEDWINGTKLNGLSLFDMFFSGPVNFFKNLLKK